MALYIGAYLPDRDLDQSAFSRALVRVATELARLRQHPLQGSMPNLDLHFLMPGREEQPPFDGMRFHSFDARSNTLRMESAVPQRMLESTHAEAFVIAAMQDAVDNAHDFFAEREGGFERDGYLSLIDDLNGAAPAVRTLN